uniref:BTB domain-containing protein n=1 Tax=Graphocephala atropunctata TaxID=36148 RepID=A0A1B6LEF7_9HEMI
MQPTFKMVTETKEKKNVKLGNWQVFLLERLNQLYSKGDMCDVTLKFCDNTSIKAHKLVLSACTNFFENLPSTSQGVVLHMPQTMKESHVRSIVNFMYTGKLEYMSEDHQSVLLAAKHLGMNVLTELLQVKLQPSKKPDKIASYKKYIQKHNLTPVTAPPTPPQPPRVEPTLSTPTSPTPPPPPQVEGSPGLSLPGKKLPFWRKRSVVQLPEEFYRTVNKKPPPPVVNETPRPTRFEWPEEEILPDVSVVNSISMNSFQNLSYDSKIMVKPVTDPKPVITDDSIDIMPTGTTPVIQHGTKRPRVSEVVKGYGDDDDDYDDGHFETIHDLDDDLDDEPPASSQVKPLSTPPKPILKNHEVSTPTPQKKVRFMISSESRNPASCASSTSQPAAEVSLTPPPTPSVSQETPSVQHESQITPNSVVAPGSANHAKIINEILKKYPDLVKNNKNIKLKIQSGGAVPNSMQNTVVVDKEGKGQKKIQYVVLKSDVAAAAKKDIKTEFVMGPENRTGPWFCVTCGNDTGPKNFETYYTYRKHLQEVHNERIDARICEHCGFKASKRNLHLYHLYTKHNIPPPRNINFPKCDQCEYIALSESLLIKHRSNHTGMMSKEFVCRICNAAFKSNGALMGHMQTNLHHTDPSAKKEYECEYCGKAFNRNINLKAHIRSSHQEENRKMYDDEDRIEDPPETEVVTEQRNPNQSVMEVIEVPVFDSVSGGNKALYLPQGMTILAESPAVPLMPSSESEAMNNVASGIATSINIADRNMSNDVIVIDGHSEIILRGTPAAYVLNQDGSYSVQEYIVPEIMSDSGQVYTTTLVSTAPATGISYVNTDNISIVTSGSDHTYADGTKINGHITTNAQVSLVASGGPTVIASQVQVPTSQPIIVQEPIIMSTDWVQSIATSQPQSLQKVEIISAPVSHGQKVEIISAPQAVVGEPRTPTRTAQTLVSDWGDLDEDNQGDCDQGDSESDIKPSRPTIDLDVSSEMDI